MNQSQYADTLAVVYRYERLKGLAAQAEKLAAEISESLKKEVFHFCPAVNFQEINKSFPYTGFSGDKFYAETPADRLMAKFRTALSEFADECRIEMEKL